MKTIDDIRILLLYILKTLNNASGVDVNVVNKIEKRALREYEDA